MSEALHFSETTLQEVALVIMALVYTTRLIWIFRFKAGRERQPATGAVDTTKAKGVLYSWFNVAMPWAMESTRKNFFMYIQFVVFHLGVIFSLGLSFVIPYGPGLLEYPAVVAIIQISTGAACLVGAYRLVRRLGSKYLRAISSPDDYFSLAMITVWFFFAYLAAPNRIDNGEWHLLTYFIMTAFFILYVPFSKISHYLYYPITRYYFGKTMGYRGTYPIRRGPKRVEPEKNTQPAAKKVAASM